MKTTVTATAAVFAAFTGLAAADIVPADASEGPIVARQDSTFTVELVSSRAGWRGELSLVDNTGLLLSNKGSTTAAPTQAGSAEAGEAILFQYEVVTGTKNIFRQDDQAGGLQFRHAWTSDTTARLFVEDQKLPGGDADFNDAVYDVRFTPIPTPGTVAMGLAGGAFLIKRRR